MPPIGNNPDGYNAFGGPMEREMPYGEAQKQLALTRLAPTAQPVKKGERRRSRGRASGGSRAQAPPSPPPAQPVPQYDAMLREFWLELAAEPGASPLIQQLAAGVQ